MYATVEGKCLEYLGYITLLKGGFNCSCHPGFTTTINTDNNNETMECIDYNECEQDTNPCGSHGECINLEGELTDYLIVFLLSTYISRVWILTLYISLG